MNNFLNGIFFSINTHIKYFKRIFATKFLLYVEETKRIQVNNIKVATMGLICQNLVKNWNTPNTKIYLPPLNYIPQRNSDNDFKDARFNDVVKQTCCIYYIFFIVTVQYYIFMPVITFSRLVLIVIRLK